MKEVNTVMIEGKSYGLLAITDCDMSAAVYAIPIEEWEKYKLHKYQEVEEGNLPEPVLEKIEKEIYIQLQIANVYCV